MVGTPVEQNVVFRGERESQSHSTLSRGGGTVPSIQVAGGQEEAPRISLALASTREPPVGLSSLHC